MNTTSIKIGALLAMVAVLSFSGCGGGEPLPEGMPNLQSAKITVTQDGKGLEGASVALIPADGSNFFGGGRTDANGVVVLRTQGKYDGMVPGKYKVTVTKRYTTPSSVTFPDPDTDPAGYNKALELSEKEKLDSFDLVDPKFAKPKDSPEEMEIVAGKNEKTIDVGAAVRVKIE